MAKTTYVVTAPYITVVTGTPNGPRLVGFYAGATLPDDVSDESIKHHLDQGMIAKSADAEKELAAAPGENTSPTGSTGEIVSLEAPSDLPKGNASLDEWAAYAKSQGMTDEELDGLSRDQLRERYTPAQ